MKGPARQRGVILAITMVMLLLLTIVGLSSMSMATMQERMAGNSLDRNYALQAAEAGLRDAELDIALNLNPASFPVLGASAQCGEDGLCVTGDFTADHPWKDVIWSRDESPVREFGAHTGAPADMLGEYLDGLPEYVIEYTPEPGCERKPVVTEYEKPAAYDKYRVTANGVGRSPGANARLQSTYQKRFGTCG